MTEKLRKFYKSGMEVKQYYKECFKDVVDVLNTDAKEILVSIMELGRLTAVAYGLSSKKVENTEKKYSNLEKKL